MHPKFLERFKCKSKNENNKKNKNWGMFFNSKHFGGKRGVLELRDEDYNE